MTLSADQVVTTSGSKDAIYELSMALMNPGDLAVAPVPGYPTYNIGHVFASATTFQVPLLEANGFLVDFDAIPREVCRQAKILWINYPNNPTTAVAPLEFFARAVEFGRKHEILIAHDSAYAENTYEGYRSPSILQVPGAEQVAVEFFSHSKSFNMTGWRAGFMAGNASAVKALSLVKDNTDNGTLRAIQFAAAYALDHAEEAHRADQRRLSAAARHGGRRSTRPAGSSKSPRPRSTSGRPSRRNTPSGPARKTPVPAACSARTCWKRPAWS